MVNSLYPLYLKLAGKPVLVAGGGSVAWRRVEALVEAGARVTVISPDLAPELRALHEAGKLTWLARRFRPEDTPKDADAAALVLLATGDLELARAVRARVKAGTLLNVAEEESLSDFHVPAVAASGVVKVAISTGGASPAAAVKIRDEIEAWLEARQSFLKDTLAIGRLPAAKTAGAPRSPRAERGKVYLVGAGPGNPELLTLRAADLLENADIVYHDRLISDAILARIPPRVEKVYVGKEVGCATRANIEELMVESARAGLRVVRLKGGDPLVFGRGGEEILALKKAGIELEIVPGVSALSSVPGAVGIPVTFRGVASEIVVRSGHALPGGGSESDEDAFEPADLAAPCAGPSRPRLSERTYVYFMAAKRLAQVVEDLRAEGLPASTPVAVIQKGTLPDEKVLTSNLGNVLAAAEREPIETPALVVVGEVVKFLNVEEFRTFLERHILHSE